MGFFAGLTEEKYDRKYSDKELAARISVYFKPYLRQLLIMIALVLVVSVASSFLPIVVSNGVDQIKQNELATSAGRLFGIVFTIGIIRWLANWLRRRVMVRAIVEVVIKLSQDAFEAATNHDLSFYDEYSAGRIQSRITSDTRDFGNLITLVTDIFSQIAGMLILGVVLVRAEWRLSLYVIVIIPLLFLLATSYRQLARQVTRRGMQAMAEVNANIKESVSGITVAKNFRQEASIYTEFEQANKLSYKVNVRRGLTMTVVYPTLDAIGGIATAGLVYMGGLTVAQGIVTAGAWYLFILSLGNFLYPVMNLSSFTTQIQTGLAAAERVFALIDAEPVVVQNAARKAGSLKGEVEFLHVNFHYKTDEPVLDDFSLRIAPGENIALVGHTGAGKSSIAKLIARFYEFQSGSIRIDSNDIRTFDLASYRRQLGIVSQAPFLFSGTVLENIRYARQDATDSEIEQMTRNVGEGEWLETLPLGLHSEVGERGGYLSMGQRQLVSLMRVLIQKPAIFILDEATASIDPFTEWQIQQALNLILSSTTSILIAHRLSTVKFADRIIVLENGRIIEEGNHQTLLKQGGHYAGLYNAFFRHQSLTYVEQARILADGLGGDCAQPGCAD